MTAPDSGLVGALPPGMRLHEYVIERVLGHGGFGITYLARDSHLDKLVAIKEYLPNELAARLADTSVSVRSSDTETLDAFKWGLTQFTKEARVLARFSHPNLIQVHRFFEAHGTAYFVMDYAEGTTLAALLKDKGTIPETHLRKIIFPILNGLEEVHRLGVLHRDIKPDNIILRRENSLPVLIDFGAARQSSGGMTKSLMSVATAGYAPLEQYGTDAPQGPWTDLYAMGAVAYRAVTGKKPSDAVNRLRTDPVVEAAHIGKGRYSAHFLAAIDWALAVNPEDRPQNISDWRNALDGKLNPPQRAIATKAAQAISTPDSAVEATQVVSKRAMPGGPAEVEPTVVMPKLKADSAPLQRTPIALPAPVARAWQAALAIGHRKMAMFGGLAALAFLALLAVLFSGDEEVPAPVVPQLATTKEPPQAAPSAPRPTEPKPPAPEKAPPSAAESYFPQDSAPAVASPKKAKPKTRPKPEPAPAPEKPKQIAVAKMEPLSSFQDCPQCPVMVPLPAGSFAMGSLPGTKGAAKWEGPVRTVLLAKPFAIGKLEVTAAQWQACVAASQCEPLSGAQAGDAPAVSADWNQAQTYATWLSKATGRRYRLPSEAEWEYAVRAGTGTARFWGEDRRGQCEYANGADLSAIARDSTLRAGDQPCDDGQPALAAAGLFKPNAFGLHDLAGNAWEWTLDCWKDSYSAAPADGAAVDAPACAKRVIRGGSWRTKPESLRSANRGLSPVALRSDDLGFRVVAE